VKRHFDCAEEQSAADGFSIAAVTPTACLASAMASADADDLIGLVIDPDGWGEEGDERASALARSLDERPEIAASGVLMGSHSMPNDSRRCTAASLLVVAAAAGNLGAVRMLVEAQADPLFVARFARGEPDTAIGVSKNTSTLLQVLQPLRASTASEREGHGTVGKAAASSSAADATSGLPASAQWVQAIDAAIGKFGDRAVGHRFDESGEAARLHRRVASLLPAAIFSEDDRSRTWYETELYIAILLCYRGIAAAARGPAHGAEAFLPPIQTLADLLSDLCTASTCHTAQAVAATISSCLRVSQRIVTTLGGGTNADASGWIAEAANAPAGIAHRPCLEAAADNSNACTMFDVADQLIAIGADPELCSPEFAEGVAADVWDPDAQHGDEARASSFGFDILESQREAAAAARQLATRLPGEAGPAPSAAATGAPGAHGGAGLQQMFPPALRYNSGNVSAGAITHGHTTEGGVSGAQSGSDSAAMSAATVDGAKSLSRAGVGAATAPALLRLDAREDALPDDDGEDSGDAELEAAFLRHELASGRDLSSTDTSGAGIAGVSATSASMGRARRPFFRSPTAAAAGAISGSDTAGHSTAGSVAVSRADAMSNGQSWSRRGLGKIASFLLSRRRLRSRNSMPPTRQLPQQNGSDSDSVASAASAADGDADDAFAGRGGLEDDPRWDDEDGATATGDGSAGAGFVAGAGFLEDQDYSAFDAAQAIDEEGVTLRMTEYGARHPSALTATSSANSDTFAMLSSGRRPARSVARRVIGYFNWKRRSPLIAWRLAVERELFPHSKHG
jgi:hypothetical protein